MSEIDQPFVVQGEDGNVYAGAEDAASAAVLAGALFIAAADQAYRPSLSVIDSVQKTVVAVIGQPSPAAPAPRPSLSSLEPSTVTFPSIDDVTLRCLGTDFQTGSVIVFNGGDEPTTFVSETEVTTLIDVSTIEVATSVPVLVRNPDGQTSEVLTLTFEERTP